MFKQYRRTQIVEMRPFIEGEVLDERVSISKSDLEAGSPKEGDMIARNPKNYDDKWLVAAKYFADNFEEIDTPVTEEAIGISDEAWAKIKPYHDVYVKIGEAYDEIYQNGQNDTPRQGIERDIRLKPVNAQLIKAQDELQRAIKRHT